MVIITHNESNNIQPCIQSCLEHFSRLLSFEILVVDSQSTDMTAKMAKKLGARVLTHAWLGYAQQKNFAFEHIRGQWILSLDADERLTAELASEISKELKSQTNYNGFQIARKTFFAEQWIRHAGWWPDFQLRLFRKGFGKFNSRKVHESLEVQGSIKKLKYPMLHYSYRSISHYFQKMEIYTTLAASQVSNAKKKWCFFHILFDPPFVFIKMFILKLGFLDGWIGVIVCGLSACNSFIKYIKVFELNRLDY